MRDVGFFLDKQKQKGLAGLRVGFSFSSRDIARLFMSAKQPYNMDWPAVSATRAVYANKEVRAANDLLTVPFFVNVKEKKKTQ
jgi:hypothetical protein